ncbi:MAG: hypothetical protein OXK80_01175 [Bdellovibrionales bacterium]|nr:hypothetical protein [Bdellovibrionales bacterium]
MNTAIELNTYGKEDNNVRSYEEDFIRKTAHTSCFSKQKVKWWKVMFYIIVKLILLIAKLFSKDE